MIFMHVAPQCVTAWDKFLTILTIVTRGHMFALDVFIQMSLVYGCVIAVSTHPRSISFQYFRLDQLVHLFFGCKKAHINEASIVFIGPNQLIIILSMDDSSTHGTSGHSLMGRISDNTDNSNQTTHV